MAAGGALLITGVVLGALAQSKADEYSNAYYDQLQAIDEAGQRYETGQIVTLAAGGVLAAAGGGLLLYDHLTRRSDQRRVSLRLGAARLALRVVW